MSSLADRMVPVGGLSIERLDMKVNSLYVPLEEWLLHCFTSLRLLDCYRVGCQQSSQNWHFSVETPVDFEVRIPYSRKFEEGHVFILRQTSLPRED